MNLPFVSFGKTSRPFRRTPRLLAAAHFLLVPGLVLDHDDLVFALPGGTAASFGCGDDLRILYHLGLSLST